MELVRLHHEDYDKIVAYDKENFPYDYWKEEDWKSLLNDKDCVYYAYVVEDNIIANVFIDENPDGYIKIMNLAVDKKYRGKGLAAELLNFITKTYKENGFSKFYAETRRSNQAMQRAFAKSGYEFRVIVDDMYDHPREDGIKYQLLLEGR